MQDDYTLGYAPDPHLFRCFFDSNRGLRKQNEDNYLYIRPDGKGGMAFFVDHETPVNKEVGTWPSGHVRMAVADGMGGHAHGREMAQAAVEYLREIPPIHNLEGMRKGLFRLHDRLRKDFHDQGDDSPGTTLLVADLSLKTSSGIMGHIGDSRAYEVHEGKEARQLTHDHTYEEFDWREGDIPREEYEQALSRNQNELAQALGYGSFGLMKEEDEYRPNRYDPRIRMDLAGDLPPVLVRHADVFSFHLSHDKAILLATDGLWQPRQGKWSGPVTLNFLSRAEVVQQIQSALDCGSTDNITALIFGFGEAP
ncbi:MAG: serine/threonine-protein phosphatase [Deltaproteobacteria bacterium]|nr:serine/threonine-protein phosphatase [Deltaproteobacteria bacterium]